MYQVTIVSTFYTRSKEQAQLIAKLIGDLESLVTCEDSESEISDTQGSNEVTRKGTKRKKARRSSR